MDLTDSVVQQLRERARVLAGVADQLWRGEHLQPAVSTAQDPSVWSGTPQRAFCGWLGALDGWVRNQLSGGVQAVAERIESHARNLEDAQRQIAVGTPGVVCPAPPRPIETVPGRPPEFVMQIPRPPGPISMAPDAMKNLVNLLGQAKDGLLDAGRRVADALIPLTVPPVVPDATVVQVAAQLAPQHLLPPDALAAVGWPGTWLEVAHQLDRALQDVLDRAEQWARALAADEASHAGGLLPDLASIGAALDRAAALAPVRSEGDSLPGEQGAADADRFAALVWGKKGRCPDFDNTAGFLADMKAKGAANPAYAQGFAAAMGAMHHKQYGLEEGNGFERVSRTIAVCWTNKGKHLDDAEDRLLRPLGETFAAATLDPTFDIGLAQHLLESGLGGGYVFNCGPLRTDVALLVANHWIDEKDWAKGRDPYHIAAGLKVLAANPEAAHLYALEHADTLTKGTDPGLFHEPGGGILGDWDGPWDHGVAALAADVLRIGLVEYPAQVVGAATCQGDTPSGEAARVAAENAQRRAEAAMAAAIDAAGKGAHPGPEGRRVLAGFLATHIADVASSLGSQISVPSLRPEHLAADKKSIQVAVKEIMGDPDTRKDLLAGADDALRAWSANAARFVGDDLAQHPEMRLRDILATLGDVPGVSDTGKDLAEFYGEMANEVAANFKDARDAAAEIAGVMGLFVSKVLGDAASVAGAVVGGGVGGIVIAVGAGELNKAAESYIEKAQEELPATRDLKGLKESFMKVVTGQMEQLTAVSLWADERVRTRLLVGDPPVPPAKLPPITDPPLENPPGTLRIPALGEEPARSEFFKWFDHEGGVSLKTAAEMVVQNSGMINAFDQKILQGLFNGA